MESLPSKQVYNEVRSLRDEVDRLGNRLQRQQQDTYELLSAAIDLCKLVVWCLAGLVTGVLFYLAPLWLKALLGVVVIAIIAVSSIVFCIMAVVEVLQAKWTKRQQQRAGESGQP